MEIRILIAWIIRKPRYPTSYNTPSGKRRISETSFGSRSTEATPTKLVHPEAKVQALQDTFVKTIINTLWLGKITYIGQEDVKCFSLTPSLHSPFNYLQWDNQ